MCSTRLLFSVSWLLAVLACQSPSRDAPGPTPMLVPSTPVPAMSVTHAPRGAVAVSPTGVVASCSLERRAGALLLSYTLTNRTAADLYALEAMPGVDASVTPRRPYVDLGAHLVSVTGDQAMIVLGIAPLPALRRVTFPVTPFGSRLAAGATLARTFEVPLPLTEAGPYNGTLEPRAYARATVTRVALRLDVLRATAPGFHAAPVDFAPGFARVGSARTVHDTEEIRCSWDVEALAVATRSDDFVRAPL